MTYIKAFTIVNLGWQNPMHPFATFNIVTNLLQIICTNIKFIHFIYIFVTFIENYS